MSSSVSNSVPTIVWEYGITGHVKLEIFNPNEDDPKPTLLLKKMSFGHLHTSEESSDLQSLSIEDLRGRIIQIQQCFSTMECMSTDMGHTLGGVGLSEGETKHIRANARANGECCEIELLAANRVLLDQLLDIQPEMAAMSANKVARIQNEIDLLSTALGEKD
jgi:hypothetical protein